jgi:hypothetical protein
MELEAAVEQIKAAVGSRGWIADPGEQESYLLGGAAPLPWRDPARRAPSFDRGGRGGGAGLR